MRDILQKLHDSEINWSLSAFYDGCYKPVLILLLGGCLIGTGIWIMFFTVRRCGFRAWCYGVAMVIGGYLFAIFGGIIFVCHLPEYASTASGIDASAPPSREGFARR